MFSFEKINLILGDSFSELTKSASKNDVRKIIIREMREYTIPSTFSLAETSQFYLDKVIGTREKLLERMKEIYETFHEKEEEEIYNLILQSKCINNIIDVRYGKVLAQEKKEILTPFTDFSKNQENEKEKIYKLLGYLEEREQRIIFTTQDIRRLKITALYKEFWKNFLKDFDTCDSVIFSEDLKDKDFLDLFTYVLENSKIRENKVYIISEEEPDSELQTFILNYNLELIKGNCKEFITYLRKQIEIENRVEPKEVDIEWDSNIGKLETANEVRYNSLKINKLPISHSTFCNVLNFEKENSLGTGEIFFKGKKLKECNIKLYMNKAMKIFEIKSEQFKIGIEAETTPKGELKFKGSNFYYSIFKENSNKDIMNSLEFLTEFFSGEEIEFKTQFINGSLKLENRIEILRLKSIKEVLDKYHEKLEFSKLEENIYTLDMLSSADLKNSYESWVNLELKKDLELKVGDKLNIKRVYNPKIESLDYSILENIEITTDRTDGYRGKAKITLEKIVKDKGEFKGEIE